MKAQGIALSTDPREAVDKARELVEYSLMHSSVFTDRERQRLIDAFCELQFLVSAAREVC